MRNALRASRRRACSRIRKHLPSLSTLISRWVTRVLRAVYRAGGRWRPRPRWLWCADEHRQGLAEILPGDPSPRSWRRAAKCADPRCIPHAVPTSQQGRWRMTEQTMRLIVKPDGVARMLSTEEARRIVSNWNSLLGTLSGHDMPSSDVSALLSELPTIIAGRQSYRAGYSLEKWRSQSSLIPRICISSHTSLSIYDLCRIICEGIGLTRSVELSGVLKPETIVGIYAPSQWFQEDPHALMSYLQSGSVTVSAWCGENIEIALLVKFVIRLSLGVEGRYNLLHCDLLDAEEYQRAPFTPTIFR